MSYEIKKPELSQLEKNRCNDIYVYLRTHNIVTKEELCGILGWKYNNSSDRKIRELISNIAKIKPIISTSDSKGYKLAKNEIDLEEAEHQWKELSKRATEILARCNPLVNFIDKYK